MAYLPPGINFGGDGDVLIFSHANGYPPESYTPLLRSLAADFRVVAMPLRPLWPQSNPASIQDWAPLAADLIRWLDANDLSNVIGCGHSVGATTTLMAALQRPDLFRSLVLIDPVLMPPWFARLWRLITWLGLGERLHPLVTAARRRRRIFASTQAMYENYRRKQVFAGLDDHALRAYVDALAAPQPDGSVTLRYSPEWEARIYLTGILCDPATWRQLPDLRQSVLLVRAANSDTFLTQAARLFLRRAPQAELRTIPNTTHLVPLEKPLIVAEHIRSFIQTEQSI